MTLALVLIAVMVLMAAGPEAPTRDELAKEIAERNERCGHIDEGFVCLRPRNHAPPHDREPTQKVIPFE